MARTDSIDATLATAPDSDVDHDVVVIGGGAAGLSAAVFLARYGLDTVVLARGKSAIRQCAHLENYLGFPGGISPDRFLALGRTQVEHEGGTVRDELIEHVEPTSLPSHEAAGIDADGRDPAIGGFRVGSDAEEYLTRYVVAATAYDGEMFGALTDELDTEAEYGFVDTDAGRTPVEGLYAAGWMTDESVHQAITNAGHGARAALALIRDDLGARYWPEVGTYYVDWVVDADRYAGDEEWYADTRDWFEREVLVEGIDDEVAEAGFEHLCAEFLDRRLDDADRERRDREGQRLLLEHLDDEVIRDYARGLDVDPEPEPEPTGVND